LTTAGESDDDAIGRGGSGKGDLEKGGRRRKHAAEKNARPRKVSTCFCSLLLTVLFSFYFAST